MLQWQSWVVPTETTWPANLKNAYHLALGRTCLPIPSLDPLRQHWGVLEPWRQAMGWDLEGKWRRMSPGPVSSRAVWLPCVLCWTSVDKLRRRKKDCAICKVLLKLLIWKYRKAFRTERVSLRILIIHLHCEPKWLLPWHDVSSLKKCPRWEFENWDGPL